MRVIEDFSFIPGLQAGFKRNPTMKKVNTIFEAATSKNVSELYSYLALVNYYQRYLNNIGIILATFIRVITKKCSLVMEVG